MPVRKVTAYFKPGKIDQLIRQLENDAITIPKKQKGIRDELSSYDTEKMNLLR